MRKRRRATPSAVIVDMPKIFTKRRSEEDEIAERSCDGLHKKSRSTLSAADAASLERSRQESMEAMSDYDDTEDISVWVALHLPLPPAQIEAAKRHFQLL